VRKLKLDLDSLEVESFATIRAGAVRHGTVRGAQDNTLPVTVVIGDTGVTCTETWPTYDAECTLSYDLETISGCDLMSIGDCTW